jgi:DNA polymerase I-like protein with 3'-5' exonuclease and polymerase domains
LAIAKSRRGPGGVDNLRDVAKKVQHGLTRFQTAVGAARTIGCSVADAKEVQRRFFDAFPATAAFMETFRERLQRREDIHLGTHKYHPARRNDGQGPIVHVHLGEGVSYSRTFFGDANDAKLARDAISFALQSPVALTCLTAMWRVWHHLDHKRVDPAGGPLTLLSNQHDALLYQIREGYEALDGEVARLMQVEHTVNNRTFFLRTDVGTGKSWGDLG